jgi:U6 snRNA-associated Sm-like protein LSm3
LNLLLSDIEERILVTEYDEMSKKEVQKIVKKYFGIMFVRGDLVILLSPPQKV